MIFLFLISHSSQTGVINATMVKITWVVSLREMQYTALKQLQVVGVEQHRGHSLPLPPSSQLCLSSIARKIPQSFNATPELSLTRYKNTWYQEQNTFFCKNWKRFKREFCLFMKVNAARRFLF